MFLQTLGSTKPILFFMLFLRIFLWVWDVPEKKHILQSSQKPSVRWTEIKISTSPTCWIESHMWDKQTKGPCLCNRAVSSPASSAMAWLDNTAIRHLLRANRFNSSGAAKSLIRILILILILVLVLVLVLVLILILVLELFLNLKTIQAINTPLLFGRHFASRAQGWTRPWWSKPVLV